MVTSFGECCLLVDELFVSWLFVSKLEACRICSRTKSEAEKFDCFNYCNDITSKTIAFSLKKIMDISRHFCNWASQSADVTRADHSRQHTSPQDCAYNAISNCPLANSNIATLNQSSSLLQFVVA